MDASAARPAFRQAFPMLTATDVDRSVAFYRDAFGFRLEFAWPPDGPVAFAYLALEPLGIGIGRAGDPRLWDGRPAEATRSGVELCIETDDVDAAADHLRAMGAPILLQPTDREWGERLLYTRDPDGTPIMVAARRADAG